MPIVAQGAPGTLNAVLGIVDWDVSPAPTVTVLSLSGVVQAGFPTTALIHDGLGQYHAVWNVPSAQALATYDVHFQGNVGGMAYDGWDTVEVVAAGSVPTAGLCLLANVRTRLGYPDDQHQDDTALGRIITAVTRVVSNYTGRQFVGDVTDGIYLFDGLSSRNVRAAGRVLVVSRGIQSVTTLEIAPATGYPYSVVNPVDYFLRPSVQDRDFGWPATKIVLTDVPTQVNPSLYINIPTGHDVVRLTGRLCWAGVPPDIEQLAENQVVRLWQARLANGSDQVGNSALGVTNITRNWSIDERKMLEEGYRDYAG